VHDIAYELIHLTLYFHAGMQQQTIGHATAAKFTQQRTSTPPAPAVVQRKIAGQHGVNLPMTNIQTIKVVE
jgi:hypothetical protein